MVCKYRGKYRQAEKYYKLAARHAPRCLPDQRDRSFFLANIYHNLEACGILAASSALASAMPGSP